jgi:predicted PurR-regulated permease PerM
MQDIKPDVALPETSETPMSERHFSFAVLLLLTALALYIAYITFRPFLNALFLALVLTIAFLPMHAWIARRIRNADAAALVTEAVVVLFILIPLILISAKLLTETVSMFNAVSQQGWGSTRWSGHYRWLSEAVNEIVGRFGMTPEQLQATIAARVKALGNWIVALIAWMVARVAQQISTAVLTLIILFFFLRDRERLSRGIIDMLPLSPARVEELGDSLCRSVIANVYGMLAVGVLEGALTALAFWITGLRAPLLWGGVAMLLSFIPRVGPALVWFPAVVVLALQGNWTKAIAMFVFGALLISLVDTIVRDRVAGARVNASKLLVLLSFMGGMKAFGPIGFIAGPVVLSLAVTLSRIAREEYGALRQARRLATG